MIEGVPCAKAAEEERFKGGDTKVKPPSPLQIAPKETGSRYTNPAIYSRGSQASLGTKWQVRVCDHLPLLSLIPKSIGRGNYS